MSLASITPEPMSKVQIVVPQSYGSAVINSLYTLNLFHVKHYKSRELAGLDNGAPLSYAEELSKTLITLRAAKNALDIPYRELHVQPQILSNTKFKQTAAQIGVVYHGTIQLQENIKKNAVLIETLKKRLAVLEVLQRLGADVSLLQKMAFFRAALGFVKDPRALKEKLAQTLSSFEFKWVRVRKEQLAVIFFPRTEESKVQPLLAESGFAPLVLDEYKNIRLPALRKTLLSADKEQKKSLDELAELRQKNQQFLLEYELHLEEELKRAEIPLQFATTQHSLIASGYVPTSRVQEMDAELHRITKGHIHIEIEKPHRDEAVPVKLRNARKVKNFEVLTRLYELPTYLEVDPTSLLFITFPIFFGIMLGDVGYGLVTLGLFLWLKNKFPSGKQLFAVLIYASIVSILFGFAFGEYFGFEHVSKETGEGLCSVGICLHQEEIEVHGVKELVASFPRVMSRPESSVHLFGYELLTILFIGIIIGAVHLNFGLLIGFYNIWHAHGLKHAILEKASWFMMEAGLILLVLSLTQIIILHWFVGAVIIAVSFVMIYMGEGVKGLIEVPALFSNMLSYMRLGAVGLASVGLAAVINENLAKPFLERGGIFMAFALIVMIVGHAVNIGLGILGPFLHAVRLHYVEFFSKFFHGGGKEYNPFGYKKSVSGGAQKS